MNCPYISCNLRADFYRFLNSTVKTAFNTGQNNYLIGVKIIDRYIIKEHIVPFFGGLGVIAFVILLSHILKILNQIIEKKVPVFFVMKLIGLNLAWVLALAVPMAFLIAALIAFGRLSGYMEIIALKSSGIPALRAMRPALLMGGLLAVSMFYFNDTLLPELNHQASALARDIRRKKPLAVVQERVFIDDVPGVNLWVEEIDYDSNNLHGVTIYQRDENDKKTQSIITAPTGTMVYDSTFDALIFKLYDGEMHTYDPAEPEQYTRGKFKTQNIRIGNVGTQIEEKEKKSRGDRELTSQEMRDMIIQFEERTEASNLKVDEIVRERMNELLHPVPPEYKRRGQHTILRMAFYHETRTRSKIQQEIFLQKSFAKNIRKYKVEIQKKITLSLACILFIFVGAPVGIKGRRGGMGTAIGFGMFFFLIYWIFLIGGEQFADRGYVDPILAMWSPNIVLFILAAYSTYLVIWNEKPLFGLLGLIGGLFRRKAKDTSPD